MPGATPRLAGWPPRKEHNVATPTSNPSKDFGPSKVADVGALNLRRVKEPGTIPKAKALVRVQAFDGAGVDVCGKYALPTRFLKTKVKPT